MYMYPGSVHFHNILFYGYDIRIIDILSWYVFDFDIVEAQICPFSYIPASNTSFKMRTRIYAERKYYLLRSIVHWVAGKWRMGVSDFDASLIDCIRNEMSSFVRLFYERISISNRDICKYTFWVLLSLRLYALWMFSYGRSLCFGYGYVTYFVRFPYF